MPRRERDSSGPERRLASRLALGRRSWLGWLLAALSVTALGGAAIIPFLDLPFAWAAGSVATLVVTAEILAALALAALGKDLYRWVREAVDTMRGRG